MNSLLAAIFVCFLSFIVASASAYRITKSVWSPPFLFLFYLSLQILFSQVVLELFSTLIQNHHVPRLNRSQTQTALLLTSCGVLSFVVGLFINSKSRALKLPSVQVHYMAGFPTILLVFGCFSVFLYFIEGFGGLTNYFEQRQTFRSEGIRGNGFLLVIPTTMLSLVLLRWISFSTIWRNYDLVITLQTAFIVFLMLVPPLIIGFRGQVLIPLLQLFYLRLMISTVKLKPSGVGLLIFVGLTFTSYGIYRQWHEVVPTGTDLFGGLFLMIMARPELFFDVFLRVRGADTIGAIIETYDVDNFIYIFPSIFESISIWIPSQIWNKPEPIISNMNMLVFGIEGGISPTVIGELYLHGGVVAVVIGMFIFGVVGNILWREVLRCRIKQKTSVGLSLCCVLYVLSSEVIQGYLNLLVLSSLIYVFVVVVCSISPVKIFNYLRRRRL